MKTIHILNPAAGQGKALSYSGLENSYVTKCAGDASEFVRNTLKTADEEINFAVYGGDGTINEVVTGIVGSGSDKGHISVVPVGTGNDLIRSIDRKDVTAIDVLTVNDRYAVNAVNTGFDLEVVEKAAYYKTKPLISGPFAYVLGVISVLCGKFGKKMQISYTSSDGEQGEFDGECLLAVAANGAYYGGGFKASPAADVTDGCIDLMIIKKISRLKFISLVSAYKKGEHIDTKTLEPFDRFKDIVIFKKCKNVVFRGINKLCADGEVFETVAANIGILPGALKVITGKKEPVKV